MHRATIVLVVLSGVQLMCVDSLPHSWRKSKEPYRVCYYTTWARYRPYPANMQPSDVHPFLCSHIVIAFGWITNGRLTLASDWEDQIVLTGLLGLKQTNPKLKVLIAVGGWNFGSKPFRWVIGSERNRTIFINSVVDSLAKWNLDGLDLDWEYPRLEDKHNFTMLIKGLRKSFDALGEDQKTFLLTAALPAARTNMDGYDVAVARNNFDFVNVMSYDFYGPWDNRTGHNAPLLAYDELSMSTAAQIWSQNGMPKDKIVLGVATYGHVFDLLEPSDPSLGSPATGFIQGAYTRSDGFLGYFEICDFLRDPSTTQVWDHDSKVPYAYGNGTWMSYDNERSVRHKMKWIFDNGYAGAMLWELGMDDFSGRFCEGPNFKYPILFALNEGLGINVSDMAHRYGRFQAASLIDSAETTAESQTNPDGSVRCNFALPLKKDCFHFYKCAHGEQFEVACPSGLVFHTGRRNCAWPWEVPECNRKPFTEVVTQRPALTTPVPPPSEY